MVNANPSAAAGGQTISYVENGKLCQLHGGLILNHHKCESMARPLARPLLPDYLRVSLRLNRGNVSQAVVETGDKVLKGQVIAVPDTPRGVFVHAPTSGTVMEITQRPVATPDADLAPVVCIRPDGKDQWVELTPVDEPYSLSRPEIVQRIREAGIVGMGGAGFPTHLKYQKPAELLIVNGAECEPYISCDERLMLDYPHELLEGTRLLMHAAGASQAIIALEDQVGTVRSRLEKIIREENIPGIRVVKVPTIYPAGGEKQLIKVLTCQEVPSGGIPMDLGIVVQNTATAKAVRDAIVLGKPLIERIVTVTGDVVGEPRNFETLVGTPFRHLLKLAQTDCDRLHRLVVGGPMMGYAMPETGIGIDKTSNCLLALSEEITRHHGPLMPCIRCGECVEVCPQELLPQQLYWYIKGENLEMAREHHVFDCIECGACAWVCPSQIKLVDYYRYAKAELRYLDYKKSKAERARIRHEKHDRRLERLKAERAARRKRHTRRLQDPSKSADTIAATLQRLKQQSPEPAQGDKLPDTAAASAKTSGQAATSAPATTTETAKRTPEDSVE
jgi:electron transport complex protein RnfC